MSTFADGAARERAIIEARNLVVTAGAGTGKTSVLVERALYLVLSGRVAIERLAAITFTEKAAAELKRRLAEALIETLASLEGRSASPEGEAPRTLERLRRAGYLDPVLTQRAEGALEHLDSAFIGTLHALAVDILGRHAMAAHLPPDFAVEDELSGGLLFEEAWTRFLGEELGHNGVRGELWARVLRRLKESDIEAAARCLHSNPAATDLLAISGYCPLVPDSELDLQVRELWQRISEYLDAFKRVPPARKNKNFPLFIELERTLLEAYLSGGPDALDAVDVTPVPDFWERKDTFKAGTPDAEEMESTALRGHRLLCRLRKVDETLIRDLMDVLRPFACRIREHVRREGVLTFDDLLILARDLLRDVPSVRNQERGRFGAVLVDEFQDTDPIQYDIVFFLCGVDKPEERDPYTLPLEADRLFIVGDPKQSIYRFRGADMSAYDRARSHVLEHGSSISLLTSYRSRPEVLAPLNMLFRSWIGLIVDRAIEPEYEEILASREPGGTDPGVEIWSIVTPDDTQVDRRRRAEAREIAARIREWLDAGSCAPREIALLFRALTDAPIYMRALREAGIEFVLEGGRAFFERPEIVEAFALLGAIANPADPVALIGVLRSGFGGASDQELAEHARAGGTWWWMSADAGTGTVYDTFSRLRELDALRRTMPLDRWIQWLLTESAFVLTQVAHVDGPQRLANLRKLATKSGTLVRDRGLTLGETLRVLGEAFAGERVEGESPLADEALDVVRLTTIHKAKGLEFGTVVVPDLARRTQEPVKGTRVSRFMHRGKPYLAVEIADRERTRNLAEVARNDDQRTHDEAEAKRLLYVATTRARDRVILVNSATSSRVAWMAGLAKVGYRLTDKAFPKEGWLEEGVWHRVCQERDVASTRVPLSTSPSVDAYRAFLGAAKTAERPVPPRFRNPSLDSLLAATDKDEGEDPGLLLHAPDLARAVGVAVHRMLEAWDFTGSHDWKRLLPAVVGRTARELGLSRVDELVREVALVLEGFATSPLRSYLQGVNILGREVPILWRDPEGITVVGYADLIYRTGGRVHVADYKTDADTSPAHAAGYRGQLTDYAQAVAQALRLSDPPITEILFVRAGTRVPV